jgi:hypothetical protein
MSNEAINNWIRGKAGRVVVDANDPEPKRPARINGGEGTGQRISNKTTNQVMNDYLRGVRSPIHKITLED